MKLFHKSFLIPFSFAAALIATILLLSASGPGRALQPIQYNHKAHVETAGLNCIDCHIFAEKLASASLPKLEICQNCHSETPLSQSPEEVKLLKYVQEKREIPWVQIYNVPDHVYFSHRRHVVQAKLECAECHGNMSERTSPVDSPVKPVTMDDCMECHKRLNASTDCLACHR